MPRTSFAILLLGLCPSWAFASGLGPAHSQQLLHIAERASDFLVQARLADGGWPWNLHDGKEGDSYGGIVAESLLAGYEESGRTVYLDAARDYAAKLKHKFRAHPGALPYKPDIEFLVRYAEASGDWACAELAKKWFANVVARSPDAASEVGRIMAGRQAVTNIVGYDVALAMRAALAVEEYDYARALGREVWSQRHVWLQDPDGTFGTISRAALLSAMLMTDAHTFDGPTAELSRALVAEQKANGSWCNNETQATAYAVRALAQAQGDHTRVAARRGSNWLSATLLADGKWAHFNDGLPPPFVGDILSEVNAEALSAVIFASRL